MDDKKKICIECKYHFLEQLDTSGGREYLFGNSEEHRCKRCLRRIVNVVTGEASELGATLCDEERLRGECGPDGIFWEPRRHRLLKWQ